MMTLLHLPAQLPNASVQAMRSQPQEGRQHGPDLQTRHSEAQLSPLLTSNTFEDTALSQGVLSTPCIHQDMRCDIHGHK